MIASQVVRTEGGEERVVPLQSGVPVCSSENSGNDNLPAYLPDEDSPVKVKYHTRFICLNVKNEYTDDHFPIYF